MASAVRALHKSERPPSSSSSGAGFHGSNAAVAKSNNGVHSGGAQPHSSRAKAPPAVSSSRRSVTPTSRSRSAAPDNDPESERVRVAVRLRPRNPDDLSDTDYADCVELQPELRKLKLKKNNWNSEAYRFDEVFTQSVSQKHVYEVVAWPVVESVLDGYNGTVMAYGQTGTGKTYTLGRFGNDDASERGIMIRSMEDIIASTSALDTIEISYLQLYMESIQDLLAPEKTNITIVEDAKTGEVTVPGVELVQIRNLDTFLQLLQIGEANRHAANTKMNTESSRSHAILMVYIRRPQLEKEEKENYQQRGSTSDRHEHHVPIIRKSKLLLVDLAGSERIDKSGSEGHMLEEAKFINLSLTSLGKCINALAVNSSHIPTRDSKLTRLLRDSFGGSARTSLIITIGPSSRHHAETASTIMFGQRAMKVVNTIKMKEEFDYESLCRKLETQVEYLTTEIDRQQKLRENDKKEMEKKLEEFQFSSAETVKQLVATSEAPCRFRHLNFAQQLTSIFDNSSCVVNCFATGLSLRLLRFATSSILCAWEPSRLNMQSLRLQAPQYMYQLVHLFSLALAADPTLLDDITCLEATVKNSKFLEKENTRLELELNDVLKDLNCHKDHNNTMHDEVARLETNLKQSEQQQLENSRNQKMLAEVTQMYEEKIADLLKQLDNEKEICASAEVEIQKMKRQTSEIQMSMQKNQVKSFRYHKALAETTSMYEERIEALNQQLKDECARAERIAQELKSMKELLIENQNSDQNSAEEEIKELQMRLQEMHQLHEETVNETRLLRTDYRNLESEKEALTNELHAVKQTLQVEKRRRKQAETELLNIMKVVPESEDGFEEKKPYIHENTTGGNSASLNPQVSHKSSRSRETILSQRNTISKIFGLQKILSLLESNDIDVQIHAVKVVANLAAEDINQEKIVKEGGLDALLMLVESSQNITILRVASGAIANLAMNETNQCLITNKGGAQLLAKAASKTDDHQTLRMVAGAIANLCGNERLHAVLKEDGALKALLEMADSGNADVIAQVARGLANFAKCESRKIMQGHWQGRSLLMDDGALSWLVTNLNESSASTRRHLELAICHLAQNEENARDFISSGGLKELIEISEESARDDIRKLAKKALRLSSLFRGELHIA
ncbi:armadillo repeat-containing kinesin-like protein 1 [Dorcoceras hygrometricum]|uniref:Armadillo repeat-containing kinesin-like protein 1 n=1 Tax=Dorcoceras hygrometricum TaxID=472368 RepID=A0A2Z7A432_9LAMI|nr:armadillo repeat-containing kinesin-like protein 1 [Dorcoceras hygrometricum]